MTGELEDEAVEAIAQRVAEILRRDGLGGALVDAAELARRLGVSRSTVYEYAGELGAIRIGAGARARLRFDPRSVPRPVTNQVVDKPATRRPRALRAARTRPRVELLPIKRGGAN